MTRNDQRTFALASKSASNNPRQAAELVLTISDFDAQENFFAAWPRVRDHINGTFRKGYYLKA